LLLIALALFAVVAVCVSADEAPKKAGGGRVSFKMSDADDDDDDDEIADVAAADEPETQPEAVGEEEATDVSEKPAAPKKKVLKKKQIKRKYSHSLDDDEFEGTAEVKKASDGPKKLSVEMLKKQQEAQQELLKAKLEKEKNQPRDWRMEIIFVSLAGVYMIWFVVGMIINTKKANNWLKNMRGFLEEQFAQIGDPDRGIKDLERESFAQFYLQATGRINCIGARFLVDLRHRQDIITDVTGVFFGKRDLLTYDVMLPTSTPLVFAMMKNSEKKKMTDDNKDLSSSSVTAVPVSQLNAVKVTILTDNPAVVDTIVDDKEEHGNLLNVIESNADLFVSLHVTDRSSIYQTPRNVLRVVLRLPSSDADQARLVEVLRSVMAFADNIATLKMSKAAQARASAVRQAEKKERERRAAEEKREAMEKAKEEKKEKEFRAMTPEQRAKAEEKQRRRQEKKQKVRIVAM